MLEAATSARRCSPTRPSRPVTCMVLAVHEGGLRKPFGKEKLASARRLQGQDDPRAPVAGAGRRPRRARRQRRAAPAAGRLPGAPERHGGRRGGQPAADLHLQVVRGRPSTSPATSTSGPSRPSWSSTRPSTTASPPTSRRRSPTRRPPHHRHLDRIFTNARRRTRPGPGQLRRRVHRLDPGRADRAPERGHERGQQAGSREPGLRQADPAAEGRAARRRPSRRPSRPPRPGTACRLRADGSTRPAPLRPRR